MKDEFKRRRKILRPGWTIEDSGKGVKRLNRAKVRAQLKQETRRLAQSM